VHRELDPVNVVFADGEPAQPKLRLVSAPRRKVGDLARNPRSIFGSPRYASPEEKTSGWIGVRSNVYSLGVLARELLDAAGGVPEPWSQPLGRALAKNASLRFVSAGDLAEELEFLLEAAPPAAAPAEPAPVSNTEGSVVVPLVRTRSQPAPPEPSVVVPLTRLAAKKDDARDLAEPVLPLVRSTSSPLARPEPARPPRDLVTPLVLVVAIGVIVAGLWLGARLLHLR
jgi:hypothetical protein